MSFKIFIVDFYSEMNFTKCKLGVCFNRYELSICKMYWVVWLGDSLLCVKQPNIH